MLKGAAGQPLQHSFTLALLLQVIEDFLLLSQAEGLRLGFLLYAFGGSEERQRHKFGVGIQNIEFGTDGRDGVVDSLLLG